MFDYVFYLPGSGIKPAGGFKIVYEYANRLTSAGYSVCILHIIDIPKGVIGRIKLARFLIAKSLRLYRIRWFTLDKRIKVIHSTQYSTKLFPNGKNGVATAWQTATIIKEIDYKYQKVIYLIQGYETWSGSSNQVHDTYRLGFYNVAVSRWLQEIVSSVSGQCDYIPSGLSFNDFFIENPIETRNSKRLSLLSHNDPIKGVANALEVLYLVKSEIKDLEVITFGAERPLFNLPDWIEFVYQPDRKRLREIYNSASIFFSCSTSEGWGLTNCEAMQCGCAVVISDIPGHREYTYDGVNGILFPLDERDAAVASLINLISDDDFRRRISNSGTDSMKNFDWESSVANFLRISYGES